MKVKLITAGDIQTKFDNGDHITDAELVFAIAFFERLTNDLSGLGPKWHFSFKEANNIRL